VGGIIGNGGSTRSWMSLTLECININMLSQDIKVVDQMMANRAPRPGQILLDDTALLRARQLGENVVKGIQDYEHVGFLGDPGLGWCPECHSNVLSLGQPLWNGGGFPIECPICHCGGDLEKDAEGRWTFVLQANGRERSMMNGMGAKDHFFEIKETMQKFFMNMETINGKRKQYADYKPEQLRAKEPV